MKQNRQAIENDIVHICITFQKNPCVHFNIISFEDMKSSSFNYFCLN